MAIPSQTFHRQQFIAFAAASRDTRQGNTCFSCRCRPTASSAGHGTGGLMTDDTHKLTVGPPLRVAAPPRGTGSAVNASMNRKGWISKGALDRIRGNSDRSASLDRNALPVFPRQRRRCSTRWSAGISTRRVTPSSGRARRIGRCPWRRAATLSSTLTSMPRQAILPPTALAVPCLDRARADGPR